MSSTNLNVTIISHTQNPEEIVAKSAKLCYSPVGVNEIEKKLTSESISKFVSMLADIGHESVLEHISFTFAIEGVSRSLTHQLVRHRLASYSQQSQRYVKLEQFQYIIPKKINKNKDAKKLFIKAMEDDQRVYNTLINTLMYEYILNHYKKSNSFDKKSLIIPNSEMIKSFYIKNKKLYNIFEKKAIEDARYVLPNACETKIVVTMNARSLLNLFNHRCCNRAQSEIRVLAWTILKEVKKIAPSIFAIAGPKCIKGTCPEGIKTCGKPYSINN